MFKQEFILEIDKHMASCHASTIVDLPNGDLLASWFGGTHEGHPDVAIWLARFDGAHWQDPVCIADVPNVPLWNPVLYRDQLDRIWLFYKVAPTIPSWTGAWVRSEDGGQTWSAPNYLPAGLLGPIKDKPITLSNGDILCPTSSETWMTWASWAEISSDGGQTWAKFGPILPPDGKAVTGQAGDDLASACWDEAGNQIILPTCTHGLIQPTAWEYGPGCVKMLLRSTRDIGMVCATTSEDYGRTWSLASETDVPNPNSGIDAVRLTDGRVVLACNPVHEGRSPLCLLMSANNGETWPWRLDLETEPGEYSYPSIIQSAAGLIHCVYTYRRKTVRHAVLDADAIERHRLGRDDSV